MPSYISINMQCSNPDCDYSWPELTERGTQDTLVLPCTRCGMESRKGISVPMPLRASYHDGKKRFTDAKEASKLNREMAGSNNKKELQKEIKKLGFNFDKKGI